MLNEFTLKLLRRLLISRMAAWLCALASHVQQLFWWYVSSDAAGAASRESVPPARSALGLITHCPIVPSAATYMRGFSVEVIREAARRKGIPTTVTAFRENPDFVDARQSRHLAAGHGFLPGTAPEYLFHRSLDAHKICPDYVYGTPFATEGRRISFKAVLSAAAWQKRRSPALPSWRALQVLSWSRPTRRPL